MGQNVYMSAQQNMSKRSRVPIGGLTLEYPMSLGTYDKYEAAQEAVDYLSDHEFAVENCMIVGTDLRQVERVTGRLTRARVAGAGALSGMWMGLFVGLIFALFDQGSSGSTLAVVSTVPSARSRSRLGHVGVCRNKGQAGLHLGEPGGGDALRGSGRAQVRRAGSDAAGGPPALHDLTDTTWRLLFAQPTNVFRVRPWLRRC